MPRPIGHIGKTLKVKVFTSTDSTELPTIFRTSIRQLYVSIKVASQFAATVSYPI